MGNLTSMTDVGGTVGYGYNAVNLPTSVVEPGGHTTTFAYDDDDSRTTTDYPNGVVQRATYDDSGRLVTIDGTKGTAVFSSFSYTYSRSGADTTLRQSVTDRSARTTAYTYDRLDRLTRALRTSASGGVLSDHDYTWDAAGNRTSERLGTAGGTGATVASTFNAADQLTARGATTYDYDANGNQTGSSAGQNLVYNAADQTTKLKRGSGAAALSATYAGGDQVERASAGATTFTNTLLGVSAATAEATTGYTRDPAGGLVAIRTATSRYYYLFDGLGSVAAITNASGLITHGYDYDPFGVTTVGIDTPAVPNPWRYAGQYQDPDTGLSRWAPGTYQPELGRWTQQDPSGLDANAYVYVGGNPDYVYAYDAGERLIERVDVTGTTIYAYDACGVVMTLRTTAFGRIGLDATSALPATSSSPSSSRVARPTTPSVLSA